MNCEYCHATKQDGELCNRCGAPISKKKDETPQVYKSEPFFYNGYICYSIREYATDSCEVQFWLGLQLIERIKIPYKLMLERGVPDNCDPMPFFWELFLLAHGEKDVIEWQEKNNKYPATFLVTRAENPELQRMRSVSMRDLAFEAKQ